MRESFSQFFSEEIKMLKLLFAEALLDKVQKLDQAYIKLHELRSSHEKVKAELNALKMKYDIANVVDTVEKLSERVSTQLIHQNYSKPVKLEISTSKSDQGNDFHETSTSSRNYLVHKCKECNNIFSSLSQLEVHQKNNHSNINEILKFENSNDSKIIFTDDHGAHVETKNLNKVGNKINLEKKIHRCTHCESKFTRPYHRNKHMKEKHPGTRLSPRIRGKKFFVRNKIYQCSQCESAFTRPYYCKKHIKQKHPGVDFILRTTKIQKNVEKKNHQCTHCESSFTRPYHRNKHMKEKHSGTRLSPRIGGKKKECINKIYQCSQCESTFTRPYDCKRHMKKKHPGVDFRSRTIKIQKKTSGTHKKFECFECSVTFDNMDLLNCHMKEKHLESPRELKVNEKIIDILRELE